MSNLEQYRYDGSVRPDFESLPTIISFEELPEEEAQAMPEFLREKAGANLVEIGRLQKAFHEAGKHGLVIILQGLPYSGRSETSRFLKKGMKKGVKLYSYKRGDESHDFLWQMHRRIPAYGNICIMSGSVYSDIQDGEGRAEQVKAFEKYLKDSGIFVVRVFLNVSVKRQKKRMLEVITTKPGGSPREMPADKNWRKDYLDRFADTVAETASPEEPWYIVPADSKWYARCIVTELVRDVLRESVSLQVADAESGRAMETEAVAEDEAAVGAETAAEPEDKKAGEEAAETAAEPEDKKAGEEPAETAAEPEDKKAGEEPAETAAEPEDKKAGEEAAEAAAEPEDKKAETEEKPAGVAEAPRPARRTRRKKNADTENQEAAPAGKSAARRPRRQGPPKTVEETLAKRRRRNNPDK